MKSTGLTIAQQVESVVESDGDILNPLRRVLAQHQERAAYLKNFTTLKRPAPKNVKVVPAVQEPALFHEQAASAIVTLLYQ